MFNTTCKKSTEEKKGTGQPLVEAVQKFKEEKKEDANDALFLVVKENLKSEERKLFENIENELYVTNIYDVDDQLDPKKIC